MVYFLGQLKSIYNKMYLQKIVIKKLIQHKENQVKMFKTSGINGNSNRQQVKQSNHINGSYDLANVPIENITNI